MTVDRAVRVLRERWRMVIFCVLLGLVGAGVASYFAPRQYSSDVTLYVALQGRAENADAAYQAGQLAAERVVSYAPLLTDQRITQPVIDRVGLAMTPAELADRITVTVEPETVVLSAAVRDATPDGAATIANALAAEFVGLVQELEQPIGPAPPPPPPGQAAPEPTRIGVQIIRPAAPQPTPVSPNLPFNLALGGALGLLIGVGAVLVREARDTSVRSAARLHELVPAPVLAELDYERQVPNRPLIVDEPYGSPRAEEFRKLRTNLQFLDGGHGHRVLVVTAARMGEGTSTVACNLAITLAEAGNRVLLVDANLRSPRVADYLGLDPFPGLGTVLTGRMVWPYARRRWNRGAFDVLPAGPGAHNPSQLLASYAMAELLREVRQHYDFVIVDTPAVLPVSDAAAVSARADGVVLVVQHRRTTEEQVAGAVEALDAVSARLVGTVLTMTRGRTARKARVPSYRTTGSSVQPTQPTQPTQPVQPARFPGAPEPIAGEITSPPTGLPRTVPEHSANGAGRPDDARADDDTEATPVPATPTPTPVSAPAQPESPTSASTTTPTRPVDGSTWRPSPKPRG
jgi:capsular exopolysaccharide synthesis family protein